MNNVNLIGRITKDLELKKTKADTSMIYFNLAVKRKVANKEGEKLTDFFNCVAFGSRAEFLAEFAGKSTLIGVEGRLQSKVYVDENDKRHVSVDIVCESVQILRSPINTSSKEQGVLPVQIEKENDSIISEFSIVEEVAAEENSDDIDRSLDRLISDFSNYFDD